MKRKVYITITYLCFLCIGYFLQSYLSKPNEPLPENGELLIARFREQKSDASNIEKYECPTQSYYASYSEQCCNTYYFDSNGDYLCTQAGGMGESSSDCEGLTSETLCKKVQIWPLKLPSDTPTAG